MLFMLSRSAALLSRSAAQPLNCRCCCFIKGHSPEPPDKKTRVLILLILLLYLRAPEPAFGVGHSTTFSNSCSYASQMLKMDDEDSDSAIIASDPMKHNAF